MAAFATQTSHALQFGVPLKFMVDKLTPIRLAPSAFTTKPEIPTAKPTLDYHSRWLQADFPPPPAAAHDARPEDRSRRAEDHRGAAAGQRHSEDRVHQH